MPQSHTVSCSLEYAFPFSNCFLGRKWTIPTSLKHRVPISHYDWIQHYTLEIGVKNRGFHTTPGNQRNQNNQKSWYGMCARIIHGELCGHILYIPVFVPQMTGIEASQCHYGFSIVFIPPHSSSFKSLGKAAAERLRRPGTYIIALLDE